MKQKKALEYKLELTSTESITAFIAYSGKKPGSFIDYIWIKTSKIGNELEIGNDRNKIKGKNLTIDIKKN